MIAVFDSIEKFLSNPILWGIACVIAISISLSGKINVAASSILMWVAWLMATFGAYRGFMSFRFDPPLRALSTVATASVFAIGTLLVVRWMNAKPLLPSTLSMEDSGVQLSITCENVMLPVKFQGSLWFLGPLKMDGLARLYSPGGGVWPEAGVHGMGYKCAVKNYGTDTAFGVSIDLGVEALKWSETQPNLWGPGESKGKKTSIIGVPRPLGPKGSEDFSFYMCSFDPDTAYSVRLPSHAWINSDSPELKKLVPIRITSPLGNPVSISGKMMNPPPKVAKKRN
jgi:hypothetical protein